jgi:putative drug exporter of the RND superfamily
MFDAHVDQSVFARIRRIGGKLAGIPAGRRSKLVVVAFWLIVAAAFGPIAGKLTDVEENNAIAWLPGSAESTTVAKLQDEFPSGETTPAVVVYRRETGLTAADNAKIDADRQSLAAQFPQFPPGELIPSEDGTATLYALPLPEANDDLFNWIDGIRATVGEGDQGLDVKVTGPGGFNADAFSVFDGIDSTLLFASGLVVAVILLLTYRSPFVWMVPLVAVALANVLATAVVYLLAKNTGLKVNGQSGGILPVLVFGVGTDYAMLLIARYREELRRHESKHVAMLSALRRAGPAIIASGATVTIGLFCLLVADLNSNKSLGPVGAIGIIASLIAMMTFLPAVLVICGRRLFWPFVPQFDSSSNEEASGVWSRIGNRVARGPRPIWIGTTVVLVVLALGLIGLNTDLSYKDQFRSKPDSIKGQELIAASYPAGAAAPTTVIANASAADAVQTAILATIGVAGARPDGTSTSGDLVSFAVTLTDEPGSKAAFASIDRLRENIHAVGGALVGGNDATSLDVANANAHDRKVVMPLVLAVVLIVLALLLRSIVAPIMLIATVVLSFTAAMGASWLVFDHIFDFAGVDASLPLLSFVFLVALGIDYNIFLMSRAHEEAKVIGTRDGMLRGLAVTGGVITSAGLVLAATFSVLGVLPLVFMTELGFVVAFGVLLDTLVVRSILVPALTLDLDSRMWWPSNLWRNQRRTRPTELPGENRRPELETQS